MKMGEDKVNLNSKVVDSIVSDLFKPLNSDDSTVNIDGSVELLKYFAKDDVRSSFNLKNRSPLITKHIFSHRSRLNNAATL